jgi:hypothetical protein
MQMDSREIGGVVYTVNQAMVRRARQPRMLQKVVGLFGTVLAAPLLAIFAPLWYVMMLHKRSSQRAISYLLPIVMPMMDKAFASIKKELLKGIHGRVLDVGCGDGAWLKYFSQAQHVTELEPNPS